jgi:hypothetical protein
MPSPARMAILRRIRSTFIVQFEILESLKPPMHGGESEQIVSNDDLYPGRFFVGLAAFTPHIESADRDRNGQNL